MRRRVLTSHASTYPDPIVLARGAPLRLTGRSDLWDGHRWLWAVAEDGREGWVPDDLPVERAGRPVAAFAYSAAELDVAAGQWVEVRETRHGWASCTNEAGAAGWVPLKCLAPE